MEKYIERVEVIGLHGKFNIIQEFKSGINVIYGENGEFKTTLLHIIANFLSDDFRRFLYLEFNQIIILMGDGITYSLKWSSPSQSKLVVSKSTQRRSIAEISRAEEYVINIETGLPKVAYFPTFRSVIEAWFTYEDGKEGGRKNSKEELKEEISDFLRKIFGNFVPVINFPSLPEIVRKISNKMYSAAELAIQKDQVLTAEMVSALSNVIIGLQSSTAIESSILEDSLDKLESQGEITVEIESLLKQMKEHPLNSHLILPSTICKEMEAIEIQRIDFKGDLHPLLLDVIAVYRNILKKELVEIEQIFSEFTTFIDSLNSFLNRKRVEIFNQSSDSFQPLLRLRYLNFDEFDNVDLTLDDESSFQDKHELQRYGDLYGLSSGERQIVGLLYATHISSQEIILIDEPEISLHTMWQEVLLEELQIQVGEKQIIVCTHSPSIGANYIDVVQCMNITNTDESKWDYEPIVFENEDFQNSEVKLKPKEEEKDEEDEEYPEQLYHEEEYATILALQNKDKESFPEVENNSYENHEYYKEEYSE